MGVPGDGTLPIAEASKFSRGTSITSASQEVRRRRRSRISPTSGSSKRIVKRYSDFVTYPILFKEKDGKEDDKAAEFDEADLDPATF